VAGFRQNINNFFSTDPADFVFYPDLSHHEFGSVPGNRGQPRQDWALIAFSK
jgi:hypothetical protein